jgi:hypothetical protein
MIRIIYEGLSDWNIKPKGTPFPYSAFHPNITFHCLNKLLADRKADA